MRRQGMRARKLALPALLAALPLLLLLHLGSGPAELPLGRALADWLAQRASLEAIIFSEIRLPRALLALTVGLSLALSGAALQGLLHNPLASPGLLGVSQTAVLAAVGTLYYGYAGLAWFMLPLAAMAGAFLSVLLIFLLAGRRTGVLSLILVGIAINAMSGSLTSLALNYAPNPFALQEIYYWMLGSVANRSLQEFWFSLPFMLLGWGLLLSRRRFLDAMSLGEDGARALGFNIEAGKWIVILGVACCTGASVAVSGNIAFVGLVVPHLMRPLVGFEPGRLLWASALGGACLLLLADLAVQAISRGQELQLGVITAALGGPFFLFLILKNRTLYR